MVSYNWDKGRMVGEITYTKPGATEATTRQCVMANRISTRILYNYRPIHGLNRWNDGVAHLAPEFEWTIGFPATAPIIRLLRNLQLGGIPFSFAVYDGNYSGENALIKEVFDECRVTERRVDVTIDDVPAVTYSGMALRFDPDYKNADLVDQGAVGGNFGSGEALSTAIVDKLFEEWSI